MADDDALGAPEPLVERARAALAAARARPARPLLALAALAALGAAGWWLLRPPAPVAPEALLPVATTEPGGAAVTGTSSPTPVTVVVHVAGAVARAGVLHLPAGARVVDALTAAGGATPDADLDRINLAAPVADGGWIHVPRVGETPPPAPAGAAVSGAPGAPGAPVDINQAGADELDTLPGIGPATAAAIVAYRAEHGPFASVDALAEVSGIGEAKLARLRDLVRV